MKKKTENSLKLILSATLFVLFLAGLFNFIMVEADTNEGTDYNYQLDKLLITFSNSTKNDIAADGKSLAFKNYLLDDLKNVAAEIDGINNISVENYGFWIRSCAMPIEYSSGLSDEEKNSLLEEVKTELESKWYVIYVGHDLLLEAFGFDEEVENNSKEDEIQSEKKETKPTGLILLRIAISIIVLTAISYLIIKKKVKHKHAKQI